MRRLMDRMGVKLEELGEVAEVVFRMTSGSELVIQNPQVTRMKAGDRDVFQVIGTPMQRTAVEHVEASAISSEDVELVASQVGVSLDEARAALVESKGDLAQAILNLKMQKK